MIPLSENLKTETRESIQRNPNFHKGLLVLIPPVTQYLFGLFSNQDKKQGSDIMSFCNNTSTFTEPFILPLSANPGIELA